MCVFVFDMQSGQVGRTDARLDRVTQELCKHVMSQAVACVNVRACVHLRTASGVRAADIGNIDRLLQLTSVLVLKILCRFQENFQNFVRLRV